ncbi:hypothetical protein Ancab_007844 [Ancistrocladus abbreviatus]
MYHTHKYFQQDALESDEDGRIPDARKGASHLREIFYRMGLSNKDIVVLSGAHTLRTSGKIRLQRPLDQGSFEDNFYYVELLKGDTEELLKLPTDKVQVEDPGFRPYVELYAKDEEAFFQDSAESHKKLSELGFTPSTSAAKRSTNAKLAQSAKAIAIAAAVVMFCYLYEVFRRSQVNCTEPHLMMARG